jgi:hypothetical protein
LLSNAQIPVIRSRDKSSHRYISNVLKRSKLDEVDMSLLSEFCCVALCL